MIDLAETLFIFSVLTRGPRVGVSSRAIIEFENFENCGGEGVSTGQPGKLKDTLPVAIT